ncbi:alpha/beta hydrolase [Streptomyces sp. NP-1717]|uniref:alpha/beta hydrolase n=1 Tax=unclassified Streptomyces TaxID=2593676 RepID=UPI001F5C2991|nr:alpha/beta hydrolase [Streptomyces sp. NP-1717]MCI3224455.1 alpha/beta hydrolase [Streptomyces sp. NP-1717]WTA74952.1 alpha/beta hydrolase [Streptomyces sp. NBC_00838]
MDLRRLLRLSATGLAAAGLLVSGCTSGDSSSGGTSPESGAPAALKKYYGQKLDWRGCGVPDFQCATMKAPLDYDKPDGTEIKLAVARKKATGPGKRLGSLQVNPGGPGGSAVDYLQGYAGIGYPAPVRARYDMVAVDPRGVSRSAPVECLTGKEMDAYTQVDQTPDDTAERNLLAASYKKLAQGCAKRSAEILPHVSTIEAARDMDILRAVLGDKKLSYVGASYGTFLGATYAELFPKRVGRLVLDGAMDPSLPAEEMNRDQTAGFETAFSAFAADCVKQPDCPLGTESAADAAQRMKSFFTRLDTRPVPTGEPRRLGESLATTGVINAMYDESGWPGLRDSLTSAMDGDGSGLLALADSYYEREGDGSFSNLMYANAAVNCLDLPAAFTAPADVDKAIPSFQQASPVFGTALAWAGLNCAYWPTEPTGTPHRIAAKGAPPILVVGTTRDPATPYKWAQSLAGQLSSGVLLTYDGDGHTAYGRGSDCVDTAINTYLIEGTPPKNGKKC